MDKLKILQIVGTMNKGGVEAVTMNYYRAVHNEAEFTFVCFDDSNNIPEEEIKSLGGKVKVVPHVKHLLKFNKALKQIIKEEHFDIIHSHVNTLSVFPLRVAKKMKCPIRIAHSHSTSNKKEKVRNMIKSILRLFSKRYATHYFACSEVAGRYQFGNKAFDKGEVTLIRNAVNFSPFMFDEAKRKRCRNELGVKENEILVGTVGRFVTVKNHPYIVSMAEADKEDKFVIIGNGPLEEEIKKMADLRGLNNVLLPGMKENVADYYSAFDVFILPSLYEGLPMTGVEAEISGLYSIYSSRVSKEALITGYGNYLPIEEKDISTWINEIKAHHVRENHLEELRKEGYEIEIAGKRLIEIYRSLLK